MRLRLHFPSLIQAPASWSPLQRERLQQVAAQAFTQATTLFDLSGIQIELVSEQSVKGVYPVTDVVSRAHMEHFFAASSLNVPLAGYTPVPTRNTPVPTRNTPQVDRAQTHVIRADGRISNNNPGRLTYAHQERTQQQHQHMSGDHYSGQATNSLADSMQTFDNNSHPGALYVDSSDYAEPYPIVTEEVEFAQTNELSIRTLEESVSEESFPEIAILQVKSGAYIHAGGSPYVKAQNLARALQWGEHLFAHDGFVILQAENASAERAFFVVPLTEPVYLEEEYTFSLDAGEQAIGISASLLHSVDYSIVIVVDDRGRSFFGNRKQDSWTYEQVKQTLAHLNQYEPILSSPTMSKVPYAQSEQTRLVPTDHGMLSIIGWMDRTLFAALPWKKRYTYLTLLLAAWKTSGREKNMLLHIICSTHTGAELAAIFALLRKQGKYAKLFEHFDRQFYEMLQVLGDFTPDHVLDWRYLATVVTHMIQSSQASWAVQETTQELLNTASELLEWLLSRRIDILFSASEEIAVSPEQLSLLLWLVREARSGNRAAQMVLTAAVAQTDSTIERAIRGLAYAREAGMPYQQRENAVNSTPYIEKLQEKLHATFVLKFLRESEVLTALDAPEGVAERLEVLTKSLTDEQITNDALGNFTEQMNRGLDTLLEYPQWERTAISDLLVGMPATSRHSFLYTMLFVAPSQLEVWDLQTLQALAVHPRVQVLIREAGYELVAGVFEYVRHSWIRFDLFVERLAVKRRAIGDPLAYQELLDRLGDGEAAAFDEVDHPGDLLRLNGPE